MGTASGSFRTSTKNFHSELITGFVDLKKVSKDKKLLKQAILVMDEGFQILEKLGYTITPANQVNAIQKHRQAVYYGLKIIHNIPFMKLMDEPFSEIASLFDSFDKLKQQLNIATPNWDELENQAISKFISSNH